MHHPDSPSYAANKSHKLKVLYVDAISSPQAQTNIQGIMNSYAKVSTLKVFDYRAFKPRILMNDALVECATRLQPDLIHIGKGECIEGESLRRIKKHTNAVIIHFYGDYRPEPQPWVIDLAAYADITLLHHQDPELIQKHRNAGIRKIGFWWPGANANTMQQQPRTPKDQDIAFMGNNADFLPGHHDRRQIIEAILKNGFRLHVYGKGWEYLAAHPNFKQHVFVNNQEFARACIRSKITLGFDPVNDVYMYASWRRPLNSMASGAFHLARYFPGLETVFQNRKHLVWFQSIPEALELIDYYLIHDDEREKIALAGQKEVLAHHTWDHRIQELLAIYEACRNDRNDGFRIRFSHETAIL